MGSDTIKNKTNSELKEFINECEEKYKKLIKLANKLADEMDSLSSKYNEANEEMNKRKISKIKD